MLFGIDISEHNGDIDLSKYDHDFVIIRAGFDISTDRWFEANCQKAERAGIPYGVYWYSYALTQKSALEEAQACVKTIQGKRIQCGVWFDMEDADGYKKKHGWQMDRSNISAICETFCTYLQGIMPGSTHRTAGCTAPGGSLTAPSGTSGWHTTERIMMANSTAIIRILGLSISTHRIPSTKTACTAV